MTLHKKTGGVYGELAQLHKKAAGIYGEIANIYAKIAGTYVDIGPAGTPPPDPPATTMTLGVNGGWATTWQGAWMFNDLTLTMGKWQRVTGAGSFTQDQGLLTPSVGTDEFRAYLADAGKNLPSGTYTVYNPDGCNIAIGDFSNPTAFNAYTTATSFTFSFSGGSFLGLWAKGNVTRTTGKLAIILPGQTANHLAGNKWNTEFMSFVAGLDPVVWRCMDWNHASDNYEKDWTDRVVTTKISYTGNHSATFVPWEDYCDFANRAGVDIWINIPTRATDAYITSLAQLFAGSLNSPRKVYLEYSNEVWNLAAPWGDGTKWIEYLDHTRYTLTADPTNDRFTLNGHGFSANEPVVCFTTIPNKTAEISVNTGLRYGSTAYVKSVDANNIQLSSTAGGAAIDVATGMVNITLVRTTEASKVANQDEHYAERSIVIFDTFSSIIGPTRIKRICGSQAAGSSHTSGRLAAPGMSAKTDYAAIALYVNGDWMAARLAPASTQLTPGFWANTNMTVHYGVYAQGSTPTIQQVIDGNGTGFVAKTTQTYTAGSAFSDVAAITGLVNGTTYTVKIVCWAANGYEWMLSEDVVVTGASPVTVYAYSSHDDQLKRWKLNYIDSTTIATHAALAGSIPIIFYEGGPDFNKLQPQQVTDRMEAWLETTQARDGIKHYLYTMAAKGCKLFNYYGDVIGLFSLADGYNDTADLRYVQYASFAGEVAIRTLPVVGNQTPGHFSQPGAYPANVHTMPDATLTYSILNGDNNGNYSFSGPTLRMNNDTGITWAASAVHTLLVEATDGFTSDTFTISFSVGTETWYATDAFWAWSSIDDSNNAAMNPAIGNALSLTTAAGTEAVIASGLWDMNGSGTQATYSNASAFTSGISMNNPFLFAFVIERDADTPSQFTSMVQLSSGSRFLRATWNTTDKWVCRCYNNDVSRPWDFNLQWDAVAIPNSKTVCWVFYDGAGNWTAGKNQTNTDSRVQDASGFSLGQYVAVSGSTCKHGSIQIVSRAGLTLAQAKDLVQKMQDHHGIA